jgi:hypothetical protein
MLERLTQTAVEQAGNRTEELKSIRALVAAVTNTELPENERKSLFFALERFVDYCAGEATMDSECLEIARNRSLDEWDELDEEMLQQAAMIEGAAATKQ